MMLMQPSPWFKLEDPYFISFLNPTHIFKRYAVRCHSKDEYKKEKAPTMCSKYDNHHTLNNQRDRGTCMIIK